MSHIDELINSCEELSIPYSILENDEAVGYINSVINAYEPIKTTWHLSIGKDSISVPLEEHEFSFSESLDDESAYIFFDQESTEKHKVFVINNAKLICRMMENSYGMEYFRKGIFFIYSL